MTKRTYTCFCMTINNPVFDDFEAIRAFRKSEDLALIVIGFEHYKSLSIREKLRGVKRTPHLQIFVAYARPVSFYEVKACFKRAHIEPARTFWEGIKYTFKEDCFEIYGSMEKGWKAWELHSKPSKAFSNKRRENIEGGVSVTPPRSPDDSEPFSSRPSKQDWEAQLRFRKEHFERGYWND